MNINNILERFGVISNLTLEEAQIWTPIANDCINEIRSRIKSDVTENNYENLLNAAAAKLLYYKVTMFKLTNGDSETFSAGDIKIKSDKTGTIKIAKKIWVEAEKSIAHLLVDKNFAFSGVALDE